MVGGVVAVQRRLAGFVGAICDQSASTWMIEAFAFCAEARFVVGFGAQRKLGSSKKPDRHPRRPRAQLPLERRATSDDDAKGQTRSFRGTSTNLLSPRERERRRHINRNDLP